VLLRFNLSGSPLLRRPGGRCGPMPRRVRAYRG